jgi:lysyl-tRNA synthetase, class II
MSIIEFNDIIEPNDQTEARKTNLAKMAELVGNVYPNKFARTAVSGKEDTITSLKAFAKITEIVAKLSAFEKNTPEFKEAKEAINVELKEFGTIRMAGRLTTPPRGNFVHLTDGKNKLQIYCKKNAFALIKNDAENSLDDENGWNAFGLLDHGDFVGVEGYLFSTNTGELSIHVEKLQFLAKAMLPMPDKMHGIADAEIRQRQRYADLIGSSLAVEHDGLTTREVFEIRSKTISSIRNFLEADGYLEVETPMLTPKATGAVARPFATHHNALDIPLYARIAPELYLKRLVVGGFEKVYELNRNFRNEGISTRHNPEFTMLEFYCAYMDVNGMMDFCEELFKNSVQKAVGELRVRVGVKHTDEATDTFIDFANFDRFSMKSAIYKRLQKRYGCLDENLSSDLLDDLIGLRTIREFTFPAENLTIGSGYYSPKEYSQEHIEELNKIWIYAKECAQSGERLKGYDESQLLLQIFEEFVEPNLIQPTFIVDYPKSISPLSKASPSNPNIAERFELFINGMEVANGFSELNDPLEQYQRFADQMNEREKGDDEAMVLDEDYIRALSYGMPPAAGIGIGIDRLVMLLTNRQSIRDVILFPHLRPETRKTEQSEEN